MPSQAYQAILKSALGSDADPVIQKLKPNGAKNISQVLSKDSTNNLSPEVIKRAEFADSVAQVTENHVELASEILKDPEVNTLREVALKYTPSQIASSLSGNAANEDPTHKNTTTARVVHARIFHKEPSAVLQRMVASKEITVHSSPAVQSGVAEFLNINPSFDIRKKSVLTALKQPNALENAVPADAPLGTHQHVVDSLKRLQRVQALAPTPDTISPLLDHGIESAYQVSALPEQNFVSKLGPALTKAIGSDNSAQGEAIALQVHHHAVKTRSKMDEALLQIYQTIKGTGLQIIDGKQNMDDRVQQFYDTVAQSLGPGVLDLEQLFGSMDFCACDSCQDVTSPTAYFVELLQYLRNNDLDPVPAYPNTGKKGIAGTVLEKFLLRRPDIANLELTCQNANTVLPYLDLANEVMESFVVHLRDYEKNWTNMKQVELDVHNIEGEASTLLVSTPQHTNYDAYCVLKHAVCPIGSLPYFQPLDAVRIYLDFLGTSRYDLVNIFRRPEHIPGLSLSPAQSTKLAAIHTQVQDRGAASEYLGISLDEYLILTKEIFWPIEYFQITQPNATITTQEYQDKIGILPIFKYWNYDGENVMLSIDSTAGQQGLCWVKAQFLPRSSLSYVETVALLQTHFVNPMYPTGRSLKILESIRFSYRFLQTLVDKTQTNRAKKYKLLVEFLFASQPWVLHKESKHTTKFGESDNKDCDCDCGFTLTKKEICSWVECWFECLGNLIVLESGEGPQLPIRGSVFFIPKAAAPPTPPSPPTPRPPPVVKADVTPAKPVTKATVGTNARYLGYLQDNGEIRDKHDGTHLIATVAVDGQVFTPQRELLVKSYRNGTIVIVNGSENETINAMAVSGPTAKAATINSKGYLEWYNPRREGNERQLVRWLPVVDDCNIDTVRILHLDGTPLGLNEWDRMQRFIRLYRKMGWSIDELDHAATKLSTIPELPDANTSANGASSGHSLPTSNDDDDRVLGFNDFKDTCCACKAGETCSECGDDSYSESGKGSEPDPCDPENWPNITAGFIKQLMYVKKVQNATALSLDQVLAFWSDIVTQGTSPLYTSLFLTYNLVAVDPVFQADSNRDYLATSTRIADHLPIIAAALNISGSDLNVIVQALKLTGADLTLNNISAIYRNALLAQNLAIAVSSFMRSLALFGDPFASAEQTLAFVTFWQAFTNSGFTASQIVYVVTGEDDPLSPNNIQEVTILQTVKTLYDGLNDIDKTHPDLTDAQLTAAMADTITTNASVLYSAEIMSGILGLTEGTQVYTTNAPSNLNLKIPASLKSKLSYSDPSPPNDRATLSVVGNLTPAESTAAKELSLNSAWSSAIDRCAKQAVSLVKSILGDAFGNKIQDAIAVLCAGDTPATMKPPDPGSAPTKRAFFLKNFLPYLRSQLAEKLVVQTISSVIAIGNLETTTLCLTDILTVSAGSADGPISALNALEEVHKESAAASTPSNTWTGYLIPPSTDSYTFVGYGDNTPPPLILAGNEVPFLYQQDDPNNVWSTNAVLLAGGQLYTLTVQDQKIPGDLQWKTARDAVSPIDTSALLPNYTISSTLQVFNKMQKASIIVNGFNLSSDEISYLQAHGKEDFSGFDLNTVTLPAFKRILAYQQLRQVLSTQTSTLIDLFKWASGPKATAIQTAQKIANSTGWTQPLIQTLIQNFDTKSPVLYRNEVALLQLQAAMNFITKAQLTDANVPFDWVNLRAHFASTHSIAESIRKYIRTRYDETDYETAITSPNNQLRVNQRNALIAYLIVQPELIKWGVNDADGLFEFFLIDPQMGACLQTSRIKQAISSIQSYVQRCNLGLEENYGVPNNALDQNRWTWVSSQVVWTANRKVFLFPENYIVGSLRDDKSPFYTQFEGDLMQNDINPQNTLVALQNYLANLDQVASLRMVGMYIDEQPSLNQSVLHCFGRTESAPYFFFYRTLVYADSTTNSETETRSWTPWSPVQVDIPTYTWIKSASESLLGSYVTPIVWNTRVFIFIGHFYQLSSPNSAANSADFKDLTQNQGENTNSTAPLVYWQIQLGWSEFRQGKWTTKQLSTDSINTTAVVSASLPEVSKYKFVPQIVTDSTGIDSVQIAVWSSNTDLEGMFEFGGRGISKIASPTGISLSSTLYTGFHFLNPIETSPGPIMSSLQMQSDNSQKYFGNAPDIAYVSATSPNGTINYADGTNEQFYHPLANKLLEAASAGTDISSITSVFGGITDATNYDSIYGGGGLDDTGADGKTYPTFNEQRTPYALYNWEIGFHAPMEIAENLLSNSQFQQALAMIQCVFNPYANGSDFKRVWLWEPFKLVSSQYVLEALFDSLQPRQSNQQVNDWRDNPFDPHAVARDRPVAYMKWTAMKYISVLTAWGDYYFQLNTLEALPLAIQCYILASHIYGPAGQVIPSRGTKKVETYSSLLDKWDAFGNAVVQMELAFPFSNQSPQPVGYAGDSIVLADIFGFATTRYFCIPSNPNLQALRATLDDRLYKIRNCMDINGNVRSLALWDPPIDPMQLVEAIASGVSLSSALNDLNTPMPNYRFFPLLQKAYELVNDLKTLCQQFISIKERRDGEALVLLRNTHDISVATYTMAMKQTQLLDAQKTIDTLNVSAKAPTYRYTFYASLAGVKPPALPTDETPYSDTPVTIEAPSTDGDLVLTSNEKKEMDDSNTANSFNIAAGILETLSGILYSVPSFNIHITPMGVGTEVEWGMKNIGESITASARQLQTIANQFTFTSVNSGRKASNIKQLQDRVLQMNLAGHEVEHLQSQIAGATLRKTVATQDIATQQNVIDNAQSIDDFLRNKYTNDALYSYLENSTKGLIYQTYNLAYSMAKQAEQAYRFERNVTATNFVQFGYYDPNHSGLQSGEQLYLALKQMEVAYQSDRGYDFEVFKAVSIRQLNPLALLQLRGSGTCQIDIPEVLFDMDFPGQYFRRIKSVSLTIPCVVGPYTTINCKLSLLKHRYRFEPTATSAKDYLETTNGALDSRFIANVNIPINSIAVTSGQNDSGVFDLQMKDERYIPFEGAGVISSWELQMPTEFRQFDYDSITDVIFGIRYTSNDGGDKLAGPAADSVTQYIKSVTSLSQTQGLFALFDIKSEYSSEWIKLSQPASTSSSNTGLSAPKPRILVLQNLRDRLPVFTKGQTRIIATDVWVLTSMNLTKSDFSVDPAYVAPAPGQPPDTSKAFVFDSGPTTVGSLQAYSRSNVNSPIGDWALLVTIPPGTVLDKIFLLVRYTLPAAGTS